MSKLQAFLQADGVSVDHRARALEQATHKKNEMGNKPVCSNIFINNNNCANSLLFIIYYDGCACLNCKKKKLLLIINTIT